MIFSIFVSCAEFDYPPTDMISTEDLDKTTDGLINATNGNYAMFKDGLEFDGVVDDNNCWVRQYFQLSDFSSDDIVCGQVTEDPLYYSFTFTKSPSQANSRYFWYASYKIIAGANTVIKAMNEKTELTDSEKQILGENYFLRAYAHFSLVKFFSFPYTTGNPQTNLGVILRESNDEPGQKARATVAETYQFIIADLEKAEELMVESRGTEFASAEAAMALLSRAYLFMGNYEKSIEYADMVIDSGHFGLEDSESYPNYFTHTLESPETIWAIAFLPQDNRGKFGSIASMIYSDGNSGWGEEFASYDYMDLVAENHSDVRMSLIDTVYDDHGEIATKNGIEVFYIKKFSFQDDDPNLSSPVMIRLAEMYLNRAEAYAKLGNTPKALENINEIRAYRGLEEDLYDHVPGSKNILDVVLDERRRELAFEGHRIFDLLRNHKNLERNYWGYHLSGLNIGDIDLSKKPSGYDGQLIQYNDPKTLYFIPADEILANNLCVQN